MRKGGGAAGDAARAILREYEIPLLDTQSALRAASDLSNMAMAISDGHLGIHGREYAQAVLDNLQAAVAKGGSKAEIADRIRGELGKMREILEHGESFW